MPKKKWEKPKLIVLVRGKPEERVLAVCKWNPGGPDVYYGSCCVGPTHGFECLGCMDFTAT